MGGIIGGITDAIGLTDNKGAKAAQSAANTAADRAYGLSKEQIDLAKEQLQFTKDQYADWKAVYGDLQTNLGDYYKNLGSDKIEAMGLQNQQMEFQAASKQLDREFAQRGITNSGIDIATKANATFQNAQARATIRTNAPSQAAAEKAGFLSIGLGQGTALLGQTNNAAAGVNGAYGTAVGSQTNISGNYLQQSTGLRVQNMQNMNDIVGTGIGFASGG